MHEGVWAEAKYDYKDQLQQWGTSRESHYPASHDPLLAFSKRTFDRMVSQKPMKNLIVYNVLKVTWARYETVKMTEVDDRTMTFKFQSEKDKDQIMDMSSWSVQGYCLNMKECEGNTSIDEVEFHKI